MASEAAVTETPVVDEKAQEALDLAKAHSTHDEAVQLEATLAPKQADGSMNEADVYHAQSAAETAHNAYEHAKQEQHLESEAVHSGDITGAREHGVNAGYDLQKVEDSGGASVHTTINALEDKQHESNQQLAAADWSAQTAHAYSADASANAASGDYDHAATSAATASGHEATAVDHTNDAVHTDTTSPAAEPAAAAETSGETAV